MRRLKSYPVTSAVLWVLILLTLAFVYAMFQGGFVSWFVFYSFLPIALYTLIIAFFPLNQIVIDRELNKDTLHAGETLQVTITLSRKWAFPLFYLVIEDRLPERLLHRYQKSYSDSKLLSRGLYSFSFRRVQTFHYEIPNMPRGEFDLQEVIIRTGDLFGFIQKSHSTRLANHFTVYPIVEDLRDWRPLNQSEGGHHHPKKGFEYDTTSVSSVRDYTPGDRLSWLDWKATARSAKLVTKQFEYPLNRDVVVVLDCLSVFNKQGSDEAFEYAVSLSASLAKRALSVGSSVGFVSLAKEVKSFPVENNDIQQWLILSHLAKVEPVYTLDSGYKIKRLINSYFNQPGVILVTTELNDILLANIRDLVHRGLAIEVFFVAPQNRPANQINPRLQDLKLSGVKIYQMSPNAFHDESKAGVERATS